MLPISSDYPVKGNSPVTWTIIVLCAVIAFIQMIQVPSFSDTTFMRYGAHPALVVYDIFPLNADSLAVAWSLVTSMLIHAGIWHVVGNMLFFHCFSMPVESLMGPWRYSIFYLLCGIAAGLTHALGNPTSFTPLVGASGAVAGVLAAHTILLPWTNIRVSYYGSKNTPAWTFTALWLFLQFITSLDDQSDVAWLAHLGGIAAGLLLAPLFSKPGVLVMAPTPGTDEELEHGKGFKISTLPALGLVLFLVFVLGDWMWSLESDLDRNKKGDAGEWIAIARLSGAGVPYDPARGLQMYREAAADNPAVAASLAKRLREGSMGLAKNENEAMQWYASAAERHQPIALEIYGVALIEGQPNVPRDAQRGMAMLHELADKGYASGDLLLGTVLEQGLGGVTVDLAAAAKHYNLACFTKEWERDKIRGENRACYRLGLMLIKGRGVPQDFERGKNILGRASANRVPEAQNAYALSLLTGDPESRDIGSTPGLNDAEARRLLEQAAKAGNKDAAANLALLKERRS